LEHNETLFDIFDTARFLIQTHRRHAMKSIVGCCTQNRAREIMGRNMFGIEEALEYFGISPLCRSTNTLSHLVKVPFTEETLKECRETHILVAIFPTSIVDIRDLIGGEPFCDYRQAFANDRGQANWHLVRKAPVKNSTSKTWNAQQTLLAHNEKTPEARVLVYAFIGHLMATGKQLFENVYVRCSNIDSDGRHVDVGTFGWNMLIVGSDRGDAPYSHIGLASERMPDRI
jgi:hypothetical protein